MYWGLRMRTAREMNPATPDPVIDLLEAQKHFTHGRHHAIGFLPAVLKKVRWFRVYGNHSLTSATATVTSSTNEYTKNSQRPAWCYQGSIPTPVLPEIVEIPAPFLLAYNFIPEYPKYGRKSAPALWALLTLRWAVVNWPSLDISAARHGVKAVWY